MCSSEKKKTQEVMQITSLHSFCIFDHSYTNKQTNGEKQKQNKEEQIVLTQTQRRLLRNQAHSRESVALLLHHEVLEVNDQTQLTSFVDTHTEKERPSLSLVLST